MSYRLHQVNFVLLALVGGLCLFQWHREKQADDQIIDLRRIGQEQERKITTQGEAIRSANEDIDGFKGEVAGLKQKSDQSDAEIKQQKAHLFTLERDKEQHATEAAEWKKTFAAYDQAIAARDGDIKTLLGQRDQLVSANKDVAQKANQAVGSYNGLVAKYEDLVGKYNDLAKRYQAEHAPAPASDAHAQPQS
jgi:chromosome segregation ATPase